MYNAIIAGIQVNLKKVEFKNILNALNAKQLIVCCIKYLFKNVFAYVQIQIACAFFKKMINVLLNL